MVDDVSHDDVTKLLTRLGVPGDLTTLAGLTRAVQGGTRESRRLDFKRQTRSMEDLADDLSALANSGGGVLVIGVDVDKAERAATIHPVDLRSTEQLAVQAARDGVDESLIVDVIPIPASDGDGRGFIVVVVHPSDRVPHTSTKRGRVLHRVGTHNKPMTRREIGAAFVSGGPSFAEEFGLTASASPAKVSARVRADMTSAYLTILNRGGATAFNIDVASTVSPLNFEAWKPRDENYSAFDPSGWLLHPDHTPTPKYLPIAALPSGAEVTYVVHREYDAEAEDVLIFRWTDDGGRLHESRQAVTWRFMGYNQRERYEM